MALIYKRFDKADEQVREALLMLATTEEVKKTDLIPSARVLFEYALEREPDATLLDVGYCLRSLSQEAQHFGHLGRFSKPHLVRDRFRACMLSQRKGGNAGADSDKYITLAEMAVLLPAKPRQGDAR